MALSRHRDARGELGVIEIGQEFGIAIKRLFYIKVDDPGVVRAEHAVSATQVILPVTGAVTVDADNGSAKQSLTLNALESALLIRPGVWRRLRNFAPGTVLLVGASQSYADTEIYAEPVPALIDRT
jgi:hypothetical protein